MTNIQHATLNDMTQSAMLCISTSTKLALTKNDIT